MPSARFLRVEVFTDTPGLGNPAGVIVATDPISDRAARAWAEHMRLPGNGFAWPAEGGAWHARFHTPGREVTLSGHTALATAHALRAVHLLGEGPVRLVTRQTTLDIERKAGTQWLTLPRPTLDPCDVPRDQVAAVLGLTERDLRADVALVTTGDVDLLIPLRPEVDLVGLTPDFGALGRLATHHALRGFCAFSMRTTDPASTMKSRNFIPHLGVDEDIATGSVHGPLAAHKWALSGRTPKHAVETLIGEQGEALGRPCHIAVELQFQAGAIVGARVGGRSVTIDDQPLGPVDAAPAEP